MEYNEIQESIIEGLAMIGNEAVSFYKDGITILHSELLTKSHLVAHCAREIDSAIREALASKTEKRTFLASIQGEERFEGHRGHIADILTALNVSPDDKVANQWIEVATELAHFAHRDSVTKKPRPRYFAVNIWSRYEEVLHRLFGSYFDRLTHILRVATSQSPTLKMAGRLHNSLRTKADRIFFYENLGTYDWLPLLVEAEVISIQQLEQSESGDIDFWPESRFLLTVAEKIQTQGNDKIVDSVVKVLEEYVDCRQTGVFKANGLDYINIQILFNMSAFLYDSKYGKFAIDNLESENHLEYIFWEKGIDKIIEANNGPLLQMILNDFFGKARSRDIRHFAVPKLHKSLERIVDVCGNDLIDIVARNLQLDTADKYLFDRHNLATIQTLQEVAEDKHYNNFAFVGSFTLSILLLKRESVNDIFVPILIKNNNTLSSRILLEFAHRVKTNRFSNLVLASISGPFENIDMIHEVSSILKQEQLILSHETTQLLIQSLERMSLESFNIFDIEETNSEYMVFLHQELDRRKYLLLPFVYDTKNSWKEVLEKFDNEDEVLDFNPPALIIRWGVDPVENKVLFGDTPIYQLIEYLKEFDETDDYDRINYEGLSFTLKPLLKSNPTKYLPHLYSLMTSNFGITAEIVSEINSLSIPVIREHTTVILDSYSKFLKTTTLSEVGDTEWILIEMLRVVSSILEDKGGDIDLNHVYSLLNEIENSSINLDLKLRDDLDISLLNDVLPLLWSCYIRLSYRLKNSDDTTGGVVNQILSKLVDALSKKKPSYLLSLLGKYAHSLYNVNSTWFLKVISSYECKDEAEIIAKSYIYYNRVFHEVYIPMNKCKVFYAALNSLPKEQLRKRRDMIASSLSIYLNQYEELENSDSVIFNILGSKNYENIDALYSELSSGSKAIIENKDFRYRVRYLVTKHLEISETSESQIIWDVILKVLPIIGIETFIEKQWLRQVTKYGTSVSTFQKLLKELETYAAEYPEEIIDCLYLAKERLKDIDRFYIDRAIQLIISKLYSAEVSIDHVNNICNEYGKLGFNNLLKIYRENNR